MVISSNKLPIIVVLQVIKKWTIVSMSPISVSLRKYSYVLHLNVEKKSSSLMKELLIR